MWTEEVPQADSSICRIHEPRISVSENALGHPILENGVGMILGPFDEMKFKIHREEEFDESRGH